MVFLHYGICGINGHQFIFTRSCITQAWRAGCHGDYVFVARYLVRLLDYLSDYLSRVHPLLDHSHMQSEVQQNFVEKWNSSNFPGWRVSS